MRRFELSEGKSDKFWQASREGTSLRVEYGRIGTHGQAQDKSFSSAEAAQSELDKLIREKLKKGYREVSSASVLAATVPDPVPAAPPSVAPVADVLPPAPTPQVLLALPRFSLSAAALRSVAPIRGSSLAVARLPDAKSHYARLHKGMLGASGHLDTGEASPHADKALMRAARQAFADAKPQSTLDLDAQAAAYALIALKIAYQDNLRGDDFIAYWHATAGASFAVRAFAKASTLHVDATESSLAIVDNPKGAPWWRAHELQGFHALRTLAVLATEPEHASLLAETAEVVKTLSAETRAVLAAAFERPEWVDADVAAMSTGSRAPHWVWLLLISLGSMDDVDRLLKRANIAEPWYIAHFIDSGRFDFVARYGEACAPLLIDTVERAGSAGTDRMRSLAEALACIATPEVAAFFARQLDTKELRGIASSYLQSNPHVGLLPLAVSAAGKGSLAEAARAVLRPIVASGIAVLSEDAPEAARAAIAQMQATSASRDEASVEALPRVLSSPPWTSRKTLVPPVVVALSPLPFEESMAWRPGEPESWLSPFASMQEDRARIPRVLEMIGQAMGTGAAEDTQTRGRQNAAILSWLPADVLFPLLPTLDVSRFEWSYYQSARGLVARHGLPLVDFALRSATQDELGAVAALERACSARVAPVMADAYSRLKGARAQAGGWLSAFPEAAAVGLIPLALSTPGKPRQAAEDALRFVASRGHRALIETIALRYGAEAEGGIRGVLDSPSSAHPAKLPKLPLYWSAGAFSRPLLATTKHALPLSAVDAIGTMLSFTSFDEPYPGLIDVKNACDPRSLADFAWDLFQAWLVNGASSKESWAFQTLGLFGDDDTARKLTPMIRAWPGEAAHARAVTGLDVLARIGTDVALMHLHGIAQKLKFKGLQEKAREKIDQIAEARGLTADELADRLVPDLGLDEQGSLALDFGPRRFKVVFDELLKPAVLDEANKRLPDLPKAKQTDDAEKAKEATETWKALKKDAKTIAAGQILRLEIAMCAQRRWTPDVFRPFLLEHPLLVHVVRRLVWGTYDAHEKLVSTFRVAEDGSLADSNDDVYSLAAGARVGIVHRLDLDQSTAGAWGQILADYEVLQPFAQLSRDAPVPSDAERAAMSLDRVMNVEVPTGKVLGLDARGWRRGPPQDAGIVCWYEKAVSDGLTVCLALEPGIYTSAIADSPRQKLGGVTLESGVGAWQHGTKYAFGELSPIALSELLRDLDSLRSSLERTSTWHRRSEPTKSKSPVSRNGRRPRSRTRTSSTCWQRTTPVLGRRAGS